MAMGMGGAGTGTTATWGVLASADVALPVFTAAEAACAGPSTLVDTSYHAMAYLGNIGKTAGEGGWAGTGCFARAPL